MAIQITKLEDIIKGDTLMPINFEMYKTGTSTPIILTDATIRMQFRLGSKLGRMLSEFSTATGEITITDALNGKFSINENNSFLTIVGTYFYDIEITYSTGQIKTILEGTIEVKQDVSY